MTKEIHICCGYNKSVGMTGFLHKSLFKESYKCDRKAKYFENGKWYCGKHAPSKIEEREDKAWKRYLDKINRNVQLQELGKGIEKNDNNENKAT